MNCRKQTFPIKKIPCICSEDTAVIQKRRCNVERKSCFKTWHALGGLFCSTNPHTICQCHLKTKLLSSLERKLFWSNSIKLECPLKACIAQITWPVLEFNTLPGNKQPCLSKLNWRPPLGFSSLLFIFLIELHFLFPRIL